MQRFHVTPRYPTSNPHSCMTLPIPVPESIYLRCLICCPRVVGVAHLVSDPDCNKRTPRYRMILMTCEMPYNSSLCNLGCPLPCLAHYSKITSNPLQYHKNHTHTHTHNHSHCHHTTHVCVESTHNLNHDDEGNEDEDDHGGGGDDDDDDARRAAERERELKSCKANPWPSTQSIIIAHASASGHMK